MDVTFETKCWEADWKRILRTDWLPRLVENNRFPFAERVLMINNVTNPTEVCLHAKRAVKRGWLDKYVVVRDHAEAALRFFQLTSESLGTGYVYSIAELVSIYLCRSEFLLHYAGDIVLPLPCEWIPKAIRHIEQDERIKVANLTWNNDYSGASAEAQEETDDFYLGYGFSDQCYLIKTADFARPIYGESHPNSARYPDYGGELFEKRVDSWMQKHGWLRATYKHGTYVHQVPVPSSKGRTAAAIRSAVSRLRPH